MGAKLTDLSLYGEQKSYGMGDAASGTARSIVLTRSFGTTRRPDMELTSTAFKNDGRIPGKYTCEGEDLSPPLRWSGAPDGTKSFALIVDDPDAPDPAAPKMVYVHWVLYNLPAGTSSLDENASRSKLPDGVITGINDWKNAEWGGPCPPIGRHRYFFKLYALDTMLTGLSSPAKKDVENAMQGHILAQAQLMGTYQKGD
jgi:Raf kinase inhibitor-like YbhB/YbcL family protein